VRIAGENVSREIAQPAGQRISRFIGPGKERFLASEKLQNAVIIRYGP
jgi:hypothetical protein